MNTALVLDWNQVAMEAGVEEYLKQVISVIYHISLSCKLHFIPLQYRECEYGLLKAQ